MKSLIIFLVYGAILGLAIVSAVHQAYALAVTLLLIVGLMILGRVLIDSFWSNP